MERNAVVVTNWMDNNKSQEEDSSSPSRITTSQTEHDSDNDSYNKAIAHRTLRNKAKAQESQHGNKNDGVTSPCPPKTFNGHHINQVDGEGDDVFEVKMRKNRRTTNGDLKKKQSNDSFSSTLLNSLPYSQSMLSLHKTSIFPTGMGTNRRNNDSISMSLSRVGGSDGEDNVKITGYLEKRSKMLGWKKYWFVLDGRLLLYYKSKSDYDSLSVCCGSINLGIASTVRPIQIRGCKTHPIQIVTRSQVYYLRSPDKQILDQWLLAIQEQAASSHVSKISLPVWADPGSQFFRYSFSASSQWSLNTSTEDITESLSKLPPNFFLKGGCGPSGPNKNLNNLQKCHSFASLQSPSLYSGMNMSFAYKEKLNNNAPKKKNKKSSLPEGEEDTKNASNPVTALKEELTRKLSAGKSEESETVKPSLTKPKSKRELPFLKSPKDSHDTESHYYDEIVDFEALYENCESNSDKSSSRSSASSTGTKDSDESSPQSESQPPAVPPPNDVGIYESVDGLSAGNDNKITKDITNNKKSDKRISSNSNRKSGQSIKSELNNKSSNLQEFNDIDRDRSQSLSNPNILSNRSSSGKQLLSTGSDASESRRKQSLESESSLSMYSSKENISEGKGKKQKNKGIGGFFHKMFHRDRKKSKEKVAHNSSNTLVITGPIDLRSSHNDSPVNRPTNLPVDEARKNSLTRNKQSSSPNMNPSPGSQDHANVIDELKSKVERIHHTLPLTSVADHILSKAVQQEEEPDSGKSSADDKKTSIQHKSSIRSKEKPTIPKKPKLSKNANSSTNGDTSKEAVVERRNVSQSEDFQQKLAKFNRLSESLSSAFVAALAPHPDQYSAITLGRSRSFRSGKEALPPLPPKLKNSGTPQRIYYDCPSNNRPVPLTKKPILGKTLNAETEGKPKSKAPSNIASFIRSLHKKNSAPDILFSSSSSEDSGQNAKDGGIDSVLEDILCPPPIPPKVKANSSLGSPSLPHRSTSPQLVKSEYETPSSIPVKVGQNSQCSRKVVMESNQVEHQDQPKAIDKSNVQQIPLVHTYSNIDVPADKVKSSQNPVPANSSNDINPKIVERLYQNLKFATANTIVQEYETVEETEEEMLEMYDDFPSSEYSGGGSHTYESISPMPPPPPTGDKSAVRDLRHSGIDQLQQFLNTETITSDQLAALSSGEYTASEVDDNEQMVPSSTSQLPVRAGAVSRLGHSSAIHELKRIVNYAE